MKKLLIIFVLVFVWRFFHLTQAPSSLNWDEVSVGWNAYSLLKTGSDEYGATFPISIRSFEDYKPPVLTYATVISVWLFGLTEQAVRVPSVIASVLTVISLFALIKELTKNKNLAILSILILAVMPWSQELSRIGFEASIGLFLFTTASLFLVKFFNHKNLLFLLITVIFFAAGMYTHHTLRVVSPLFVVIIGFLNWRIFLKKWPLTLTAGLLMVFLLLPLVYSTIRYGSSQARFEQISVFKQVNPVKIIMANYFSHFNFDFLFLNGDTNPRHSTQGVGELLIWQFPFILIGSYLFLRRRPEWFSFVIVWLLVAPAAAALTKEVPHASRSFLLIAPFAIITAYGLEQTAVFSKKINVLISLVFVVSVFYFFHQYFIHLPVEGARAWQYGYKEMVTEVREIEKNYDDIYITKYYDQPYIYFLFYGGDPKIKNPGNFSEGFGKYYFVDFSLKPEIPRGQLIVLAGSETYPSTRIINEVKFPDGSIAFRLAQRI